MEDMVMEIGVRFRRRILMDEGGVEEFEWRCERMRSSGVEVCDRRSVENEECDRRCVANACLQV